MRCRARVQVRVGAAATAASVLCSNSGSFRMHITELAATGVCKLQPVDRRRPTLTREAVLAAVGLRYAQNIGL